MKQNPVMTMIVPGRRALGETWSKVTVTPNAETGEYDLEREDTTAPADNIPIFVPALGNLSIEAADFALEWTRKEQEYRKARGDSPRGHWTEADITRMWHDWVSKKLKAFKRQSTSGPGGWVQRS